MTQASKECRRCEKRRGCPLYKKDIVGECYADSPDIYEEVRHNRREVDHQFGRLLDEERQYLLRNALFLMRNEADAEDLVQETFLRAYKSRDSFEIGTNFRAWLSRIQLNAFINQRRRKAQNPSYGFAPVADEETLDVLSAGEDGWEMNPEKIFFENHISDQIRHALKKVPRKQLVPFLLHSLYEFQYHEISEMMQIPIGSVKSQIFRLRENMRETLAAQAKA